MGVVDTWSRRKHQANGAAGDIFVYDQISMDLRMQIMHILVDTIGAYRVPRPYDLYDMSPISNRWWNHLDKLLAKEFGMARLGNSKDSSFANFQSFFLTNQPVDRLLDCIEISFRIIDRVVRETDFYERRETGSIQDPSDAIDELNARLLEQQVGYQYVDGQIIRVDNQLIHQTSTLPALRLLSDLSFAGPNQEFLTAHEHHRQGREREAIREASNAFESTMKAICDQRGWPFAPTDTAKNLIEIMLNQGLIPKHLQAELTSLRSLLEAGLPTVRNKSGGHGQGATPVKIPSYLAEFALNLAGSNIVFLVSAHKASR